MLLFYDLVVAKSCSAGLQFYSIPCAALQIQTCAGVPIFEISCHCCSGGAIKNVRHMIYDPLWLSQSWIHIIVFIMTQVSCEPTQNPSQLSLICSVFIVFVLLQEIKFCSNSRHVCTSYSSCIIHAIFTCRHHIHLHLNSTFGEWFEVYLRHALKHIELDRWKCLGFHLKKKEQNTQKGFTTEINPWGWLHIYFSKLAQNWIYSLCAQYSDETEKGDVLAFFKSGCSLTRPHPDTSRSGKNTNN